MVNYGTALGNSHDAQRCLISISPSTTDMVPAPLSNVDHLLHGTRNTPAVVAREVSHDKLSIITLLAQAYSSPFIHPSCFHICNLSHSLIQPLIFPPSTSKIAAACHAALFPLASIPLWLSPQ
jgi:hypothetical protein